MNAKRLAQIIPNRSLVAHGTTFVICVDMGERQSVRPFSVGKQLVQNHKRIDSFSGLGYHGRRFCQAAVAQSNLSFRIR